MGNIIPSSESTQVTIKAFFNFKTSNKIISCYLKAHRLIKAFFNFKTSNNIFSQLLGSNYDIWCHYDCQNTDMWFCVLCKLESQNSICKYGWFACSNMNSVVSTIMTSDAPNLAIAQPKSRENPQKTSPSSIPEQLKLNPGKRKS